MAESPRRRPLDIPLLLLGVMVIELSLNRLAVPALRPATETPGQWHRNLDQLALFIFHFASALAIGALAKLVWDAARGGRARGYRGVVAVSGAVFAGLAAWATVRSPSLATQFLMQSAFAVALVVVVVGLVRRTGDVWTKLGVAVLAVPILMQYYAPFVLNVLEGADLSLYPNIPRHELPAAMRERGQLAVVLAALLSPYLFAPRPVRLSLPRPAPLVIATFVGLIAGVILREQREVGMELAMMGLGFDLGPQGAPRALTALYLLALASVTWTLVSCLIADSPARRRIGVGVGLIAVAGYAFAWPLQYAVALIALFVIDDAAETVAAEEAELESSASAFHLPPIPTATWTAYVDAVVAALREGKQGAADVRSLTTEQGQGVVHTHVVATRRGVALQLRVSRAHDAVQMIDVSCGGRPPDDAEPDWTLHARAERVLAIGSHPEPPTTRAAAIRTGDVPFDRRFRVRDRGGLTDALFDDALRARATALFDGWMAYWKGRTLYYRVFPGRGAPLDTPIPISELASRGADAPASLDKLLGLLDVLTEIGVRAGLDRSPGPEADFFAAREDADA